MGIDWFTFGAQIVNFLILVWLLRKFLYGPVIGAMDRREARIAKTLAGANQMKQQAELEVATYKDKNRELEHREEELLAEIQQRVKSREAELMSEARREVEQSRDAWYEALDREQTSLAQEIRRDTGVRAVRIARRALEEFAGADLHEQVVDVFLTRLSNLPGDQQQELKQLFDSGEPIVVTSAFPLSAAAESRLKDVLAGSWGAQSDPVFRRTDEVMCGIEIRVGGKQVSWSFDDFLELIDLEYESAIASAKP